MIGILDYGAGNLRSVCDALDRLQVPYFVSDKPSKLNTADKLIFPGVGHAKSAMEALRQSGLDQVLQNTQKPIMGICLGMQLLFEFSEEGDTPCLGLISGAVRKFDTQKVGIVPHMGWNSVHFKLRISNYELPADDFYFVHSYYCDPKTPEDIAGETDYNGQIFCSSVKHGHIFGTQFHPEKSGMAGQNLLDWFCEKFE